VIKEFERHTNARVELTTIDTDEALWQKVTNPTGPAFDVFAVNTAELQRYLDAGLGMAAILAAATATARRHFGIEHPLLAPGAPFDAVLLAASPFAQPAALRRPQKVWRGGS